MGKSIVELTTPDGLVQSLRNEDEALMKTHTIKPQHQFLDLEAARMKTLNLEILEFENLEPDFHKYCDRHALTVKLPHLNVSAPHDYLTELSAAFRDYLYGYYIQDFDRFGYLS